MYSSAPRRKIPPIEELLPIIRRECTKYECTSLRDPSFYKKYYADNCLTVDEVGEMYSTLRMGGVSRSQVKDVVAKICENNHGVADRSKIGGIFTELDRRYFILENARWEFSMLDLYNKGEISESDAKTLFEAVQGNRYLGAWKLFMNKRANPGSKVKWEEIEVPICKILKEQGG